VLGIRPSEGVVRFESFELDVRSAELRNPEGKTVRLSEQPLRILLALIERPGEVVLREDLRKRLWPNDTIVEFEHSINAAVNRLRQVLGDAADNPKFIETLARRGYRWKTSVQWEQPQVPPGPEKPPDGNLIGKKVSHYRVLEVLGGGGMGVVYKAEDIKLGRRVALKFLPEELAGDASAMKRFEREARAASALNHPNICTIHAVEEHEGQPFIVMELLEGRTLRDVVSEQADSKTKLGFPINPLLDVAVQIATGLEAAHLKGIIHRDIKPANVFVTNQGQVKILDFGLAKLHEFESLETQSHITDQTEATREWNPLLTLTRTGVTVGTAAYMSPEQVRGERLDQRTDLFSFGLVLYEMVTRQRAFPGDTAAVLHDAILHRTPASSRDLNPRVPARLDTIIGKAIEKDRGARFQTAKHMREELEGLQRQISRKHASRVWGATSGLVAMIVLAVLMFLLYRAPKTIGVAPELKLRQLTTNSSENPVIGGAISPDGKYLAYSDMQGMHLKALDNGETYAVSEPAELKGHHVKWGITVWFPDSTRLLANAYPATEEWSEWSSDTSSIWSISLLGGAPTKLRDHALACAISPDGPTISFVANKGKHGEREVWFMGPNGEQARKYKEMEEGTGTDCWGWSPDGRHYSWVLNEASGSRIVSRKVSGGATVTLFGADELKGVNDIVWLHDGRVLYDRAESESGVCNYWIGRIDVDNGKRLEQPRRLTNWPSLCVASGTVTNDDKRLTFAAWSAISMTNIAELKAGGTELDNIRQLGQGDSDQYPLAWTNDSKSVILGRGSTSESNRVYQQSLTPDATESPLTNLGSNLVNHAAMTPDGKWLIALLWPQGQRLLNDHFALAFPLVRFPSSGGAPQTILQLSTLTLASCARAPSQRCVMAELSDDQNYMVVSELDVMTGRGPELARIPLQRPVKHVTELGCVISPDGTQLAVTRSPEGPVEIRSVHGQLLREIPFHFPGQLLLMNWGANQKGVFLTTRAPGGAELLYLDLQGQASSLRKCVGLGGCFAFPSPDGHHVVMLDRKRSMNMWMMENF